MSEVQLLLGHLTHHSSLITYHFMNLRIDRFTWIIILIVVALLVAAVVTVSLRGGQTAQPEEYQTADDPTTPVYNAFLALERGDIATAREQYSRRILEEQRKNNYDPFTSRGYTDQRTSRRLRILEVSIDPDDPNKALVTIVIDTYYPGGLFGGGNTSSLRRTVQIVREDDRWKLDTDEYFY
jgi:hypothetical protein